MLELSLRHAHAVGMAVRANKKGGNQSRRCGRNKNDSAEEKKKSTEVLPENAGYLGRHEKDMRREKVISGTGTAGIVLKI